MTREDIIRMARLYGTPVQEQNAEIEYRFTLEQLGLLLSTNTTLEREACAKVCDSISEDQWALYKGRPPYTGKEIERASDYTQGKSDGAEVCAAAIRARGETSSRGQV